jgi:hypothetical protein
MLFRRTVLNGFQEHGFVVDNAQQIGLKCRQSGEKRIANWRQKERLACPLQPTGCCCAIANATTPLNTNNKTVIVSINANLYTVVTQRDTK